MRPLLTIQSAGFGCAGAIALAYALFVLAIALDSGIQYVPFAAACLGLSIALAAVGAGLWFIARKLGRGPDRWTLVVLALQVLLMAAGSILYGIASQSQPEDSPFAEGGDGVTVLFGSFLVATGAVVLLLIACQGAITLRNRLRQLAQRSA